MHVGQLNRSETLRSRAAAIALLVLLGGPAGRAQESAGTDSIELVDPHVFRACADPRDLPFSNEAGEGFENKIAELRKKFEGYSGPIVNAGGVR